MLASKNSGLAVSRVRTDLLDGVACSQITIPHKQTSILLKESDNNQTGDGSGREIGRAER